MSATRKVYKFRMQPTPVQQDELMRMAGTVRYVWNWALDRCQFFYRDTKKGMPQSQLSRELTELKSKEPWLYDFDSQSLQQVLSDLGLAYKNFFAKRARFPRFKTRKNPRRSFRIPQRVTVKDSKVYVPKLGWIEIRQSQEIVGGTKSATFKHTATGKWFVTLVCEFELVECKPKVSASEVVGGDLGLNTYMTLSDGTEVENPRFFRQYARKLRRAQKHLSRTKERSRNRARARKAVARVHERIANLRGNFSHQLTCKLMRYPALCLENLSILGLAKTKLAKSMLDAAFGETIRQWKYKSLWYNKHAIQADRFFPSTQLCSECGFKNQDLTLSDREWRCPACESTHKRDHNAARNLRDEGIRILVAAGLTETLNACGAGVRPGPPRHLVSNQESHGL